MSQVAGLTSGVRPAELKAIAICGAGAVASFAVTRSTLQGRAGLAGLAILAVGAAAVLRSPRAAMLVLLALGGTFWLVPLRRISFGGVQTDEVELLGLAVLASWGLGKLLGGRSREGQPYAAFALLLAAAIVIGTVHAVLSEVPRTRVVPVAKTFTLYLLLLPFCSVFASTKAKRDLGRYIEGLVTFTAIGVLVAVSAGVQLDGRPGTAINVNDLAQTTRVRPAVLPLLFLVTMMVVARVSAHGLTAWRAVQLTAFAGVWAVSYNRSSWAALLVAGFVLLVVRPGPRRRRNAMAALLALTLATPLSYGLAQGGRLGAVPQTVAERVTTLFGDDAVTSNSFADRNSEYDDAFRSLSNEPVLGVGVGGTYGARYPYYDPALGVMRFGDRAFSHNSALFLYLQLGLLGVVAFTALSVQAFRFARRQAVAMHPGSLTAVAAACALLGAGIESLFNTNLLARPSILAFAVAVTLLAPPVDAPGNQG